MSRRNSQTKQNQLKSSAGPGWRIPPFPQAGPIANWRASAPSAPLPCAWPNVPSDAYNGDIRRCEEISKRLAHDVRQGVHARKVMESYQAWFGEGPELSVLRMLGLFDRPADEPTLGALLKPPAIRGLTEPLTNLSPPESRMTLGRLRRARLLGVPKRTGSELCFLRLWVRKKAKLRFHFTKRSESPRSRSRFR
jgi:hypothetical protein